MPQRGRLVERLPKIDPREIDRPHGRYTVEFFDDLTGRRVHREVKDNYITPLWEKQMLGHQYANPYLNAPVAHNSTVYSRTSGMYNVLFGGRYQDRLWNPFGNVCIPMDSVILTNDPTVEDTTDTWLRGLVIAYATRWKATVDAAGARGLINEAECAFSNNDNTHKTVWDWTTQQGNGTFQCLAIGGAIRWNDPLSDLGGSSPGPRQWAAIGPRTVLLDTSIPAMLGSGGNAFWAAMVSNPVFDGTTMFFLSPGSNTGADNYDLRSLPEASVMGAAVMTNDEFVTDARGLTSTVVCDTGVAHLSTGAATTASPGVYQRIGLAKVGSDFVMAYTVSNALRLRRFTTAGAQVWQQNSLVALTGEGRVCSVLYDGSTHLYVMTSGNGGNTNIYRCNPATGAITATIPVPASILGTYAKIHGPAHQGPSTSYAQYPWGMCWHPDGDILISTGMGICKMSVGGTATAPYCYGMPALMPIPDEEAGALPWSTQASWNYHSLYMNRSNLGWGSGVAGIPRASSLTGISTDDRSNGPRVYGVAADGLVLKGNGQQATANLGHMFIHGGKLWVVAARMVTNGWMTRTDGVMFLGITGNNFFSKVTLDDARTKTSSQNMKVSYELTWPTGNEADRAPHPDIE